MMQQPTQKIYFHKSVLVHEVLFYLDPQPHKVYIDATFGTGGHSRAILEKEPQCKVIALDWDVQSLETYAPLLQQEFGDRFVYIWDNFAHLYKLLKKVGVTKVDGIFADFGTSQIQISERPGFSLYKDAPLDMRMSPPHQKETAATVVNEYSQTQLRDIFWNFGEEKFAKRIAQAIEFERKKNRILTTRQLAELVQKVVPFNPRQKIHPATRVFQALRIYVNDELAHITAFLPAAIHALNPSGRLVCISFHSLEDRLVKQFFKKCELEGLGAIVTKKVVVARQEEIAQNPSARSAKLRAFQINKKQ
jgi:16S rRNA (cytosine1402-N4)-methyltransferase